MTSLVLYYYYVIRNLLNASETISTIHIHTILFFHTITGGKYFMKIAQFEALEK
jgi:hypothetical protein